MYYVHYWAIDNDGTRTIRGLIQCKTLEGAEEEIRSLLEDWPESNYVLLKGEEIRRHIN